ncbi:MAG: hypothetical protein IPO44_00665 [Candidatus Microthrix sp.]|nr:transporter associated domain-containing protein [Candidatus Microthrix sp.]MBK9558130.1 hypothetical protein [Candidatus Microthrix sp.]
MTMEDLLEELVGEIEDESDRADPLALPKGDESMLLRGSLSIDDANEYLEEHLSLRRVEPLPEGDWGLGRWPDRRAAQAPADVGDEVEADAYRLTVLEMRGRRIMWVLVESLPDAAHPPTPTDPATPDDDSAGIDDGDRSDERNDEHG